MSLDKAFKHKSDFTIMTFLPDGDSHYFVMYTEESYPRLSESIEVRIDHFLPIDEDSLNLLKMIIPEVTEDKIHSALSEWDNNKNFNPMKNYYLWPFFRGTWS